MFSCFKSYRGWAALGFAVLLGGYLVVWHGGANLAAALPFLVLAVCPLMHVFMHRGHGHHHGKGTSEDVPSAPSGSSSVKGE